MGNNLFIQTVKHQEKKQDLKGIHTKETDT